MHPHLVQWRARVDLSRRTRAQQQLNLRQVVEDPIPLGIALAELVRLSTSHALEDHVRRSRQQHNDVEARIELPLIRNTAGDEQAEHYDGREAGGWLTGTEENGALVVTDAVGDVKGNGLRAQRR